MDIIMIVMMIRTNFDAMTEEPVDADTVGMMS
jgi:hypothetical protein